MSHRNSRSPVGGCLYDIIHRQPGIHFRALERAADLSSAGQLRHHLDRLSRDGSVVEVEDGGYKRYFVADDHDRRVRLRLARYARPMMRHIGYLLLTGPLTRAELRHRIGCADSTLGYYLARMLEQDELTKLEYRDQWRYALVEPEAVRQVLNVQQPTEGKLEEQAVWDAPVLYG